MSALTSVRPLIAPCVGAGSCRPLVALLLILAAPLPGADLLDLIGKDPSLESNLRTLCDEIGPRPSAGPAMRRAVSWALEAFEAAGADSAHTESFTMPLSWAEGDTRVEVLAPARFAVDAAATALSAATRRRGVRAEVIDAGRGDKGQVKRLGRKARGKVILVELQEATTFHGLGVTQRNAIYSIREAAEVGAAAVLFASTRANRVLFRHIHSVNGSLDPLPSAVVAREDALRIARLIEAGERVEVELQLPNRIGGPVEGQNVVAEIRGSDKADEVVILGAHLDSWDLGSGCLDNGVNVALVLETARAVAALAQRPARTIRFVLFSGEEQGLWGSRAYVERHRDELDDIVAVVVHDMGQGKIEGYSLGGRAELEEPLRRAMESLDGDEAKRHTKEAFFGSDHFDFLLEGVPALVAMQDTSDYVLPYHSEVDTYDKVSLYQVRQRTRVAAATVWGLANLPERFGSRLSRDEISKLLDRTSLDDQMEFLDLLDEWESGKRGRRP